MFTVFQVHCRSHPLEDRTQAFTSVTPRTALDWLCRAQPESESPVSTSAFPPQHMWSLVRSDEARRGVVDKMWGGQRHRRRNHDKGSGVRIMPLPRWKRCASTHYTQKLGARNDAFFVSGSWVRAMCHYSPAMDGPGSAVSSPSGVRGKAPAAKSFVAFCVLQVSFPAVLLCKTVCMQCLKWKKTCLDAKSPAYVRCRISETSD